MYIVKMNHLNSTHHRQAVLTPILFSFNRDFCHSLLGHSFDIALLRSCKLTFSHYTTITFIDQTWSSPQPHSLQASCHPSTDITSSTESSLMAKRLPQDNMSAQALDPSNTIPSNGSTHARILLQTWTTSAATKVHLLPPPRLKSTNSLLAPTWLSRSL